MRHERVLDLRVMVSDLGFRICAVLLASVSDPVE